jgi:hypothetical protein
MMPPASGTIPRIPRFRTRDVRALRNNQAQAKPVSPDQGRLGR